MTMNNAEANKINPAVLAAVAILIGFGIWARFIGLGTAPLIDDEYYLAKSIQFIIGSGLPEFPSGGFYTRGLLQQYLTAGLLTLFSMDLEFAVRLVPAICNCLCLIPLYIIAKRAGGPTTAVVALLLFSLSLWETEFARFARMYAPFQLLFLTYVVYWLRAVIDGDTRALTMCALLACLGIGVYAGSLLLLMLCLVPHFLHQRPHIKPSILLVLFGIGLFTYTRFGIPYPVPVAPADLQSAADVNTSISAVLPAVLAPNISEYLLGWVALAVLLYIAGFALKRLWQQDYDFIAVPLLLSVSVMAACLSLLALSIFLAIIAFLLDLEKRSSVSEILLAYGYSYLALLVATTAIYGSYLLLSNDWYGQLSQLEIERYPQKWAQGLALILNFPEVGNRFLRPMLQSIPLTFVLISIGMLGGLFLNAVGRSEEHSVNRFLFILIIVSILFVGITGAYQTTTRYSFFFYPILLVTAVSGITALSRRVAQGGIPRQLLLAVYLLVVLTLGEDYSFEHQLKIDRVQTIYRGDYKSAFTKHILPRRDFESPIRYVNEHRAVDDIVILAPTPTDLYLGEKPDYMYIPLKAHRFWERNVSPEGLDVWSDAPLLYRFSDLEEVVRESRSDVWLVVFAIEWNGKDIDVFKARYGDFLEYSSVDKTVDVFHIEK